MKTRILSLLTATIMILSLTACGGEKKTTTSEDAAKKPVDLTGTWTQIDKGDSYQEAVIADGIIEINWISEEDNSKSIYWVGTYDAPTKSVNEFRWTSERDTAATDMALLASTDDTKEFSYADGIISYEVSALGTTTTIELEKTSDEANLSIPESEPAETIPEGEYSDIGSGTMYVSTPAGTSEDGNIPVLYVDDDTFYDSIGLDVWEFDGSKLSYIYINRVLKTTEQLADTQTYIDLERNDLKPGVYKVEVLQFDSDTSTGTVVTYKTASFEIKSK